MKILGLHDLSMKVLQPFQESHVAFTISTNVTMWITPVCCSYKIHLVQRIYGGLFVHLYHSYAD